MLKSPTVVSWDIPRRSALNFMGILQDISLQNLDLNFVNGNPFENIL